MFDVLPDVVRLAVKVAGDDFPRGSAGRAEREAGEDDGETLRGYSTDDGDGDAVSAAVHVRGGGPAVAGVGEFGAGEEEDGGGDAVHVHAPESLHLERVRGVEELGEVHVEEGGNTDGFVGGFGGGSVGE